MASIAIKTVGCRLNQAESAQMAAQLEAAGHVMVPSVEDADIAIIHTCTITANAERTCLKAARAIKRTRPDGLVVMAGCAVESSRDRLLNSAAVDVVADQQEKADMPQFLRNRLGLVGGPAIPRDGTPAPSTRTRALVKVQDGCDFCCAYCIVPRTRGTPRSRPAREIVREIEDLESRGFREVVLTGANLGLFCDSGVDLVGLIAAIEDQTGIERIRLSSIESTTVEAGVVARMAASDRLCRFLHVPLQSGDTSILQAMGRKYTAEAYRRTVLSALDRLPLLGLGTDIIVGFPGETEKAFRNTVALVEELPFSNLHVFPYSKRPDTRAAAMDGQIPEDEKKARVRELTDIGRRKRAEFARRFVGHRVSVLVERIDGHGLATGWTGEYIEAHIADHAASVNDILTVVPDAEEDGGLTVVPPGNPAP